MPASGVKFWILILGLFSIVRLVSSRSFVSTGGSPKPGTSISQIRNPKWTPKQFPVAEVLAEPFWKHKIPMPKALQRAVNETFSGSPPGSGLQKKANGQTVAGSSGQFVFPVRIGTPSQTLYLLFDTGSGDFWVWSWLMPTSITSGRNIYVGTTSSTAVNSKTQSFNVNYASGSAYGVVWEDTVWIDGGVSIGVTGNPVECAQNVGGDTLPALTAVDGLFGLNLWVNDSESPIPQETWLAYILPNLNSTLFTVCLVQNGIGTMDFGYIDSSKYTGSITYTPVVSLASWPASGYWLFEWTGFAVGNNVFNTTGIQVLTDTGTNLVNLPESIAYDYYAQVNGSYMSNGGWTFPCTTTLPSFTFGVGKSRFTVGSKHMIFTGLDDGVNCIGAIQPVGEDNYAIFGVPWLNALFLVHDYGKKRLGFAARTST